MLTSKWSWAADSFQGWFRLSAGDSQSHCAPQKLTCPSPRSWLATDPQSFQKPPEIELFPEDPTVFPPHHEISRIVLDQILDPTWPDPTSGIPDMHACPGTYWTSRPFPRLNALFTARPSPQLCPAS